MKKVTKIRLIIILAIIAQKVLKEINPNNQFQTNDKCWIIHNYKRLDVKKSNLYFFIKVWYK